jgi:hypothetical protein
VPNAAFGQLDSKLLFDKGSDDRQTPKTKFELVLSWIGLYYRSIEHSDFFAG